MNELIEPAKTVSKLKLTEKLTRLELFVSHYNREEGLWKLDVADASFTTIPDPNKNKLFGRALTAIFNRVNKTGVKGRIPRGRRTRSVMMTDCVSTYLDALCDGTKTTRATMVSLLILQAHASYRAELAEQDKVV